VTTLDISVNDVQLRLGKRLARMSSAAAGFLVQLNRTEANVKVLIEHFSTVPWRYSAQAAPLP
jgi:hypothetical protein